MNFSILGAVHAGENPDHLHAALESLHRQTLQGGEVILIQDGPLEEGHYNCLEAWKDKLPIEVFPLNKVGLAQALNEGLLKCSYDLVARFDTDDINKPNRFESQVKYFEEHPNTSVLSSCTSEFLKTPGDLSTERRVPLGHDKINWYAKFRNPINHMAVMFRKKDVLSVGGYNPGLSKIEDYDLWLKMMAKGYRFANISAPLVNARVGNGMVARRRGLSYIGAEKNLLVSKRKYGLANGIGGIVVFTLRVLPRLLPTKVLETIYNLFLRNSKLGTSGVISKGNQSELR